MDPIEFLTWEELLEFHRVQLQRYGGQDGFISENVVRSVMSRPQFTSQYDLDAQLSDLAADYMFGFATTQGFLDGNKRTALAAASAFVRKNGLQFMISEKLMYVVAMAVANGLLDRDGLAEVLHSHMIAVEEE